MPRGRYSLHDPHDRTPLGEERFHCAPGPEGWRYVATRHDPDGRPTGSLDLTLDALGRTLRLEARAGAWQVRGGALDGLSWVRGDHTGAHALPGTAEAHAFTGTSPAFLVATARLLRPAPGAGATRVRLVTLTEPGLAPRHTVHSWRHRETVAHRPDTPLPEGRRASEDGHPESCGPHRGAAKEEATASPAGTAHAPPPLTVHTYEVADLETGEQFSAYLSGDIVLAARGMELEDLDGPPSEYATLP